MEESLKDAATERARALGFSTFSAYVVQLIRRDLMARGELTLRESPPPPAPPSEPPPTAPTAPTAPAAPTAPPSESRKRLTKKKP